MGEKKWRHRDRIVALGAAIVLLIMAQSCATDGPAARQGTFEVTPSPALSPDGAHLLAASGSVLQLLSFPELSPVSVVYTCEEREEFVDATGEAGPWSPTRGRFVFAVAGPTPEGPSKCRLFLGDLAGGVQPIAEAPGINLVVWSPEGRRLFTAPPLAIIDVETGEEKRLELPRDAEVRSPVFSPDGLVLAFTLFAEGEDLWVWDWTKNDLRRITEGGKGCYPKKWLDAQTILVGLGAVSTGGGHEYGLGKVDARGAGFTALDDDPESVFSYLLHIPEDDVVLGSRSDSIAGEGARVVLKDLSGGGERVVLEGTRAIQALPAPAGGVAMVVVGEDRWQIVHCRGPGDTVRALVTSDGPLRLLGGSSGAFYYLQGARSGDSVLRAWDLRRLDW